jgi:MarR family transcriptional regulator, transcriptional regulator for hemolysin
MTLPQCRALVYLAMHEGLSQVRLAELTDIEPMTLVRILDRMEADGWLERRIDPADRRARRLHLRAKAKPLVDTIWNLADLTREEAFSGMSKKQTEGLIASLDRVRSNFGALEPLLPASAAALEGKARRRHGRGTPGMRREPRARRP